jgi:hypothetical protein
VSSFELPSAAKNFVQLMKDYPPVEGLAKPPSFDIVLAKALVEVINHLGLAGE